MGKPSNFDGMMYEYCVGLGHCGGTINGEQRNVRHRIPADGYVTADEFVEWLLWAEGYEPHEREYKFWQPKLRDVFLKHMNNEAVPACLLVDHEK
ncbi:MAG: hypothetical protein AAFW68_04670 [Pseudomonadota bacterium]